MARPGPTIESSEGAPSLTERVGIKLPVAPNGRTRDGALGIIADHRALHARYCGERGSDCDSGCGDTDIMPPFMLHAPYDRGTSQMTRVATATVYFAEIRIRDVTICWSTFRADVGDLR